MDVMVKYFPRGGNHADDVLAHVQPIVESRNITDIVVATTRGETAVKACKVFDTRARNVIAVTHSAGFTGPNQQELKAELKAEIVAMGGTVLTATHALSGVETGITKKLAGGSVVYPVEMFARLLRVVIGDGVKVCIEIALMAADAGLLTDVKADILCIAGTGTGADTACIIRPAYTRDFTELRVKQVLCKPEIARD